MHEPSTGDLLKGSGATALWRPLLWPWIIFWLLMLAEVIQQSLWTGRVRIWSPVVDTVTSALAATVLIVVQMRRADRYDTLIFRPLRWFLGTWAEMPLLLVAYLASVHALQIGIYALAGRRYAHGPWLEVLSYEATRFVTFYALLSGVLFGLRSYAALAAERVRSAQQANLTRQAQLAQLTQQLQPHFLFNALNTISSLIHSDPDAADQLLSRLATLLRAATEASQNPEHALADELILLHAYADIMVRRFADRVQVSWDIDPAAQTCQVPTLGLQPLLENCFRHVVERRNAFTRIAISARRSENLVVIEIADDGDLLEVPDERGVGLGNLENRLQSLYGAQARLALRVRPGGGLVAEVCVPCVH